MKRCSNQAYKEGRLAGATGKGKRRFKEAGNQQQRADKAEWLRGWAEGHATLPVKQKAKAQKAA